MMVAEEAEEEEEAGAATAAAPPLPPVLPLPNSPLPLATVFILHLGLPGTDPSARIATLKRWRREEGRRLSEDDDESPSRQQ